MCQMILLVVRSIDGRVIWFQNRSKTNRGMVVFAGLTFIMAELIGKIAGFFCFSQEPFAEMSHVNLLIQKEVNSSFPSDHTIFIFSVCLIFWLFHKRHVYWLVIACLTAVAVVYLPICQRSVNAILSCYEWLEQKIVRKRTI
ncbi:phosphatase PAP2 family protein [Bacillus altitudinis]|nr:phosphatase PAP2 family protein [Bacillus altitudinis]